MDPQTDHQAHAIHLIRGLHRMDTFNLHTDTPDEIAAAVVGNLLASRAERIARAVLKLVAERKQNGHAG